MMKTLAVLLLLAIPAVPQTDPLAKLERNVQRMLITVKLQTKALAELADMSKQLADLQDPRVATIMQPHLVKVSTYLKQIVRENKQ